MFDFSHRHALAGRTILQIIPELEAGGAERTTIDIAAALAGAGARPLVACTRGRLISELQAVGGIWLPFNAATKNPLAMALNTRALARLLIDERVDLIHARSRAPAWVALGAVRRVAIPFVTTYHGSYNGGSALKLRYNSVMARGDAVIANSQFTARMIDELYPFARQRLQVIERGTDFARYDPAMVDPLRVQKLRAEWGVTPDQRIILLAARLTSWKGHRVLIEAARLMVQQGITNTRFVLAGDAQGRLAYERELDGLIETSGLTGIVTRVGHCADMPAALRAASVIAVPSTEPEAFGRVAVEAQAMGVPVVVSNLGAVQETVLAPPMVEDARRTGWHVQAGDAAALAATLIDILAMGASAREALARRARIHVEQNFSLERMCMATLAVYDGLLRGDARPPA